MIEAVRYEPDSEGCMHQYEGGDWVQYSDYEELEKQNADFEELGVKHLELLKRVRELEEENIYLKEEIDTLHKDM